jgi:hypothetical protein
VRHVRPAHTHSARAFRVAPERRAGCALCT